MAGRSSRRDRSQHEKGQPINRSLKIYFAGAISAGRDRQPLYGRIVHYLVSRGNEVLTEHVASKDVLHSGSSLTAEEIYERDMQLLDDSDALVAEVSQPSLGVGIEIAIVLRKRKPVLKKKPPEI